VSGRQRTTGAKAAKKPAKAGTTKSEKSGAKAAAATRRSRRATTGSALTQRTREAGAPVSGGQVTKVSVSIPGAVADAVREVAGHGQFSAYVARAVERQLERDRLAELVAGIEETLGHPISDELMTQAEAAWHAE
jgi:hypothetical protein